MCLGCLPPSCSHSQKAGWTLQQFACGRSQGPATCVLGHWLASRQLSVNMSPPRLRDRRSDVSPLKVQHPGEVAGPGDPQTMVSLGFLVSRGTSHRSAPWLDLRHFQVWGPRLDVLDGKPTWVIFCIFWKISNCIQLVSFSFSFFVMLGIKFRA